MLVSRDAQDLKKNKHHLSFNYSESYPYSGRKRVEFQLRTSLIKKIFLPSRKDRILP